MSRMEMLDKISDSLNEVADVIEQEILMAIDDIKSAKEIADKSEDSNDDILVDISFYLETALEKLEVLSNKFY